ncbi:sugar transporter [Gluconacetobacter diazotrophicus PA1 5]|uniref:Sugar porter family MFS transporter n=2 Tax=Gluconacetobacter diazotrophicus TaxID=33996 RepID=A0A7W4FCF5_GLUDI|nr:sugar porter family MFS transporter [Gluconacetobacter diazotrophicus]ACI51174.1 sugar transporter [Gluconacetobacter diazotrophicus PA1 5]MBB2155113.1 sugar porter family MFS transporter [Gluconacetobacter diazotrophicus]CAP54551.1 putative galactose-proton symporter [Gluconacetobacter diazotrophicus PA1 5]
MNEKERPEANLIIDVIAGISAAGGLLFGYDTGIISAALLQIAPQFHLGIGGQQIVTSAIIAGALLGCLGAAPLSDRGGRRRTVMLAATVFIIGTAMASLAGSVWMLTLARFVLGLAVGAASQIVPLYISELAPARRRGRLVGMFQLAVVSGVLVSFIVGYLLRHDSWRVMFGLGAIPAVILLLGMAFLPNSPRWLAMRGDFEGARVVLRRVRGNHHVAERELQDIIDAHDRQAPWSELAKPWVRPALVASIGIGLLCQLSGINAVLYYAPTIFSGAGFGEGSALLTSVAVGVAMIVATLFGSWAVEAIGRRTLMLWMLPGASVALFILASLFHAGQPTGLQAWAMVASLLAYAILNVGSLSVTIWIVGAEIYPLSVRGKGMSLVAASHWGADLLISLTTLSMVQAFGAGGTFMLFGVVNALAFLFVLRYVPETRGRSLEEIEASLRDGTFVR